MSDKQLPGEWVEATISEIADVNPKKIDAAPETVAGFVPMSHAPTNFSGNLEFEEKYWSEIKKSYTNFKEHDVLVAKVTPCFENGKAAIVKGLPNKIGAGSSEFYVIRPAIQEISSRFLFSIVKSYKFVSEGAANMTGAVGLRRVPRSFVENFPVLVPPLAEQKVIADKLDTLLGQVEATKARLERIPEILKNFRQSVLADAVSGKLLETKAEWKTEVLSDCFDCIDGDRGPNYPKKNDYQSEGYCLFLSTKNVRQFGFDFKETVFISKEKDSILRKGKLERGDLVITTRGTIGYVASYDNSVQYEVARINSGMLILRKKDPSYVNDYFKILIASPYFQKLIEKNRTGSAQPQLPAKILKEFELPVPPSEEQAEIVFRVDQLFNFADSIEQKANAALERVNNLSQSILAKAFRGELTTDWRAANPELISGENSAEGLLAKIKTERAKLNQGYVLLNCCYTVYEYSR